MTTWVMPWRSRTSRKISWPWSRRRWTQPARRAVRAGVRRSQLPRGVRPIGRGEARADVGHGRRIVRGSPSRRGRRMARHGRAGRASVLAAHAGACSACRARPVPQGPRDGDRHGTDERSDRVRDRDHRVAEARCRSRSTARTRTAARRGTRSRHRPTIDVRPCGGSGGSGRSPSGVPTRGGDPERIGHAPIPRAGGRRAPGRPRGRGRRRRRASASRPAGP